MRSRRALLYMPGDDLRKIQKATTLAADCVCLDLEDGVAANRKGEARASVTSAMRELDFGKAERLVRVNPIGSGLEEDDLSAALAGHPDGIVVPKCENAEAVTWTSERIGSLEEAQGWPLGEISLIVLIETARGVVNLPQIAAADPRLRALIFGAEDLAGDIGAVRTREGWEVFYARSAVVTHAAAYGLQAIDMVYVDFTDPAGLAEETAQAVRMGYAGKQVIHPGQIEPVQSAFTPDDVAIAAALRLTEAYAMHQHEGRGAFALDGKMVDAPALKAAERVLARARAAGKV